MKDATLILPKTKESNYSATGSRINLYEQLFGSSKQMIYFRDKIKEQNTHFIQFIHLHNMIFLNEKSNWEIFKIAFLLQ